jgi:hypothetical protein
LFCVVLTGDTVESERNAYIELYSFAFLPHIEACGHEKEYDQLYDDMVVFGYDENMTAPMIDAIHNHLNCLGLTCIDIGSHIYADEFYPECLDANRAIAGYTPVNTTKANMVSHH